MKYIFVFLALILCSCALKKADNKQAMTASVPVDTSSMLSPDTAQAVIIDSNDSVGVSSIQIGTEFKLYEGNSAKCLSNGLQLTVLKVRDNRCPPDVQCIRAGEIEVDVAITYKTETIHQTLTNPTRERKNSVQLVNVDDVTINFIGSTPTRKSKINVNKLNRDSSIEKLPLYFLIESIQ